MAAALAVQGVEWCSLPERVGAPLCVAGDFNVNLGGPHYYGSNASKQAVRDALDAAGLVACTDFERTQHRRKDHGLIDHVALSADLARWASVASLWPPRDEADQVVSDHWGVAVDVGPR